MSFWMEHPLYLRHRRACGCDLCAAYRLLHAAAKVGCVHPDVLASPDRHRDVTAARRVLVYLLTTGQITGVEMPLSTTSVLLERDPAWLWRTKREMREQVAQGDEDGAALRRQVAEIGAEYARLVALDEQGAGGY